MGIVALRCVSVFAFGGVALRCVSVFAFGGVGIVALRCVSVFAFGGRGIVCTCATRLGAAYEVPPLACAEAQLFGFATGFGRVDSREPVAAIRVAVVAGALAAFDVTRLARIASGFRRVSTRVSRGAVFVGIRTVRRALLVVVFGGVRGRVPFRRVPVVVLGVVPVPFGRVGVVFVRRTRRVCAARRRLGLVAAEAHQREQKRMTLHPVHAAE